MTTTTTTTVTRYRVTASRPIGDGRHESLDDPATLGDEICRTYATADEAQAVAADLQSEVEDYGLDPATRYGVQVVESAAATYSINAIDSDSPSPWMDLCLRVTPGVQDSGRCRYEVAATDAVALETALEDDDNVLEYERL